MKLIGYWFDPEDETETHYPKPQDLVDFEWLRDERQELADYLTTAVQWPLKYWGFSWCRFHCGISDEAMGSFALTDGEWIWPAGLAHYITHHGVKLPEAFVNHARQNLWKPPKLSEDDIATLCPRDIDQSFWLSWANDITTKKA